MLFHHTKRMYKKLDLFKSSAILQLYCIYVYCFGLQIDKNVITVNPAKLFMLLTVCEESM